MIHTAVFLASASPGFYAISVNDVFKEKRYYTILAAAFVHGGVMHICMNMLSLIQLGTSLEGQLGTSQFLYFSAWSIVFCGCLYLCVEYVCYFITGSGTWLEMKAVGYSGVLFSYAVIESYSVNVQSRSLFGLFNVPAVVYPWVLLILLSLIMPNVSFVGHFSGILVGILTVSGATTMLFPSKAFQEELEQSDLLHCIYNWSNYIRITEDTLSIRHLRRMHRISELTAPFCFIFRQLYFVTEAILILICNST